MLLNPENFKLRVGRSVGRTLYIQVGDEASKDDLLVGLVDNVDLAEAIVRRWNLVQENSFKNHKYEKCCPGVDHCKHCPGREADH